MKSQTGKKKNKKKQKQRRCKHKTEEKSIRLLVKGLEKLRNKTDYSNKLLYEFIDQYKGKLTKRELFLLAGISHTTFYNWKRKGIRLRYNQDYLDKIKSFFFKHNQKCGFRRITAYLWRDFKIKLNRKTTYRYMLYLGLKANIRHKTHKTREIKNTSFNCGDLIQRHFRAQKPSQKIYTDITFLGYQHKRKFAYLSITIDGFNNQIIDYQLSLTNDSNLIITNIKQTLKKCCPYIPIIHSDHAVQYTSHAYQQMVRQKLLIQSMSRVGNSLDNRPAEYFFSIFKQEFWKDLNHRKITLAEIKAFIHYYNYERIQGCLNNITPIEYKKITCLV